MYAEERMDIPGFRDYMLSNDFWWFVGIWLGNGWIDRQCRVGMAICLIIQKREIDIIGL